MRQIDKTFIIISITLLKHESSSHVLPLEESAHADHKAY